MAALQKKTNKGKPLALQSNTTSNAFWLRILFLSVGVVFLVLNFEREDMDKHTASAGDAVERKNTIVIHTSGASSTTNINIYNNKSDDDKEEEAKEKEGKVQEAISKSSSSVLRTDKSLTLDKDVMLKEDVGEASTTTTSDAAAEEPANNEQPETPAVTEEKEAAPAEEPTPTEEAVPEETKEEEAKPVEDATPAAEEPEKNAETPSATETTAEETTTTAIVKDPKCDSQCQNNPAAQHEDMQAFDGDDLLKPQTMLKRLQAGRKQWVDTVLKEHYGEEHYLKIFQPGNTTENRVSVGRRLILDDPNQIIANAKARKPGAKTDETEPQLELPAWGRMVTKYTMKLLQLQLAIVEERLAKQASCLQECSSRQRRNLRFLQQASTPHSDFRQPGKKGIYADYLWITMGMSSSAGHGNLFDESYTLIVDAALKPIMKQIGLDYEARSYGMGGADGAPQLALCINSIAGTNVDHITWDFGQTDSRFYWKLVMFAYRAAMISQHPTAVSQPGNIHYRPSLFVMHPRPECVEIAKEMQLLGMDTLVWNADYMQSKVMEEVPDMLGMTDDQIEKVPKNLQYFKCGGKVENGDPGCTLNKWTPEICPDRKYRTGWHPGWKIHALEGNLMAMTALDLWEDAIQKLIEMEPAQPETLEQRKERLQAQLQQMDQEDKKKYDNIFEQPVPEGLQRFVDKMLNEDETERLADIETEAFLKAPAFCEFASLPADQRMRNFYTENLTETVGHYTDLDSFESGIDYNFLRTVEVDVNSTAYPWRDDKIKLVKNSKDHQKPCGRDLHFDFKDVFMVSSVEGKRRMTIPNDAEKKYYTEFDAAKSKGYIVTCVQRVSEVVCCCCLFWPVSIMKSLHCR